MPNGKPEESCLRGGEEDADGRRVRMSHHHQPPSLNFSSVKTAFIADDGRDGRSGFYVQRACTCFPPIFHSQSQITHSHPSSRLLLGLESVHFEEKAGFNGSQWGNSSKLRALSPSLLSLQFESTLTVRFPPRARGTSDPESFRGGPCDVQAKKS